MPSQQNISALQAPMANQTLLATAIRTFGLDASTNLPMSLDGGQGTSFLVGDAVLKPVDNEAEHDYVMALQDRLITNANMRYRIARPLVRMDGGGSSRYIVEGWSGARFVYGEVKPQGRWAELLDASRAFHGDLQDLVHEPPSFVGKRMHRWERANQIIWDEYLLHDIDDQSQARTASGSVAPVLASIRGPFRRLLQRWRALDIHALQTQLIHGDLCGNTLFTRDGSPPAIIDLSLYWLPVEYAEAVVVADGLMFHGGGDDLIKLVGTDSLRMQMLVRALLFRALTRSMRETGGGEDDDPEFAAAFMTAVSVVESVWDHLNLEES